MLDPRHNLAQIHCFLEVGLTGARFFLLKWQPGSD